MRNHLIRAARPENNEKADLQDPLFLIQFSLSHCGTKVVNSNTIYFTLISELI